MKSLNRLFKSSELVNRNQAKKEAKMKKINLIGLAVVLISGLVLLNNVYADTLTVPTQYPTIQAAIDAADPGDTVLVLPGTYNIDAQINVIDKNLTIKSEAGAEATILNGHPLLNNVFFLQGNSLNDTTTIDGFTITMNCLNYTYGVRVIGPTISENGPVIQNNIINGPGASSLSTGVFVYGGAKITVQNNIIQEVNMAIYAWDCPTCDISNNTISAVGAGMHIDSSSTVQIFNNTVSDVWGMGIIVFSSTAQIFNNTLSECAYGIDLVADSTAQLFNNTISECVWGGICVNYDSITEILNCTVAGSDHYGILVWNGAQAPTATITNSIVYGSGDSSIYGSIGSVTYSNIEGTQVYPGEGNINANPLFINSTLGDYHLQSGSPCIDAGNPDPIYNDPDGTRNDMGVYGGPNAQLGAFIAIISPQSGQIINLGNEQTVTWNTFDIEPDQNLKLTISHLQPRGTSKQEVVDFKDVIPNTGSYSLPVDLLLPGIEYSLDLSVAIGDIVNFQTE